MYELVTNIGATSANHSDGKRACLSTNMRQNQGPLLASVRALNRDLDDDHRCVRCVALCSLVERRGRELAT